MPDPPLPGSSKPAPKRPVTEFLPKDLLIQSLQDGYRGRTWQGNSVRGALKGVSHEMANLRSFPGRPTIWETVLHLVYVRHRELVRIARVQGKSCERFPRSLRSSCWPELPPVPSRSAWKEDQELLETYQARLVGALKLLPEEFLAGHRSRHWQFGTEILGIVLHDAYHVGQMRLLRLSIEERYALDPSGHVPRR